MKYLSLIPDYTSSCLRDDFSGVIELEILQLPHNLIDDLTLWHNEYRKIIPLGDEERAERIKEIEELDNRGIELTKRIKDFLSDDVKIRYYSEGKLRYLNVD